MIINKRISRDCLWKVEEESKKLIHKGSLLILDTNRYQMKCSVIGKIVQFHRSTIIYAIESIQSKRSLMIVLRAFCMLNTLDNIKFVLL